MQIETYEVTEQTTEMLTEDKEQAIKLIESLGLEGQEKFVKGSDEGNKNLFPYRKMTRQERNVYSILCPRQSDLKSYHDSPIPVRIMQVAAHAMSFDFFRKLVVWYPDNADVKDPVLVGEYWKGTSDWQKEVYILARWGEVLEPLSECIKKAAQIHAAKMRLELTRMKSAAESALMSVDEKSMSVMLGSDDVSMPSFYIH